MFNFIVEESKDYKPTGKDALAKFINKHISEEKLKEDFFDLYLSSNANDILVNLEDLKFLDTSFDVENVSMHVCEQTTNDDIYKNVSNIIDYDTNSSFIDTDVILILFKIHSDNLIMCLYDAMDLINNLVAQTHDSRDILFGVKYDDKIDINYSQTMILSVKEYKEKLTFANNITYGT